MKELSPNELYMHYFDALCRCGSALLNREDEDIEYELFEQFDIDAHSILHEDSLSRLLEAGYIDDDMMSKSKELRKTWLSLQNSDSSMEDIRLGEEWRRMFSLCDDLIYLTKARN